MKSRTLSVTVEAISDTFCDAIPPYRTALSVAVRAAFETDEANSDQPYQKYTYICKSFI